MSLELPELGAARVLVVGDVMLDRYWHGATERISPEAPVPVVRVTDTEARAGGAANVAANLSALGAQAGLIGVTGADAAADELAALLREAGVRYQPVRDAAVPTVCKMRVLSRHQQLMRLDFEELPGSTAASAEVLNTAKRALADCDVMVLSDYAKGAVSDSSGLIAAARARGVRVLVDPKGRSFERYRGAFCLTPNRGEFEAVVGACRNDGEISRKGAQLCRELDLQHLLVTRGDEGMSLLCGSGEATHLHARAREVFDVTGAGDTVIAVLAAALAAGADAAAAMHLANTAAGLVVARLGTAVVSAAELRAALRSHDGQRVEPRAGGSSVDLPTLLSQVHERRARGERVVMTNGCFDLLHAGHVYCLEQARGFGDCLIVAVNDDASVRRLKGAGRPLTPLAQRMAVLGGLRAVDWVVPFADDTPAALIEAVLPDVLVKGGDYTAEQIVGADTVTANGGQVRTVPLHAGLSTSVIVAAAGERTQ